MLLPSATNCEVVFVGVTLTLAGIQDILPLYLESVVGSPSRSRTLVFSHS